MDTIRPIRESELDELIDLLCAVHNPPGHERYRGYMEGKRRSSSLEVALYRPCAYCAARQPAQRLLPRSPAAGLGSWRPF